MIKHLNDHCINVIFIKVSKAYVCLMIRFRAHKFMNKNLIKLKDYAKTDGFDLFAFLACKKCKKKNFVTKRNLNYAEKLTKIL